MEPLSSIEDRLCNSVMQRIYSRRSLKDRLTAGLYGSFLVATLLAFIPAFEYAAARASETGFLDYVSLIASDWNRLSSSWYTLSLSLAESAPIMGGIAILGVALVFVFSVQKFINASARLPHLVTN